MLTFIVKGVLNQTTGKVHKKETERSDRRAVCGATHFVAHDRLKTMPLEQAVSDSDVSRCGRCFADAGGY